MNAVFAQGGGGLGGILIPTAGMFLIFYFLVIIPNKKKQQRLEEMRNTLKNGDKVVTEGGIFGTVAGNNEKENAIVLQIAPSVKIEVAKNSIVGLRTSDQKEEK